MNVCEVRDQLLREHTDLRARVAEVLAAMDRWGRGEATHERVRSDLTALADAVRVHNAHEERALGRLMRKVDAWGGARVEIMNEEHLTEHVELHTALSSSAAAAEPSAWRHLVEKLLARLLDHMAREERAFLNDEVLRDDGVVVEMGS
jgi:hypothetical protein